MNDMEKQGALSRLVLLRRGWREILPDDPLRELASRLLDVHTLRASDSLQLAAALTWCQQQPAQQRFSLAINGFVMRPRLRGSLSLLWYGLEHRRSEDPRLPQVDRGISCPSLFGFSSISWLLVHDLCTAPSAVPASLSPAN